MMHGLTHRMIYTRITFGRNLKFMYAWIADKRCNLVVEGYIDSTSGVGEVNFRPLPLLESD